MKIKPASEITDFNGKPVIATLTTDDTLNFINSALMPFVPPERATEVAKKLDEMRKPLTLKSAIYETIGGGLQGFSGEEMMRLYLIATKFAGDPEEVDLESADIALLRRAIEKRYTSPLVIGRISMMLEGKE